MVFACIIALSSVIAGVILTIRCGCTHSHSGGRIMVSVFRIWVCLCVVDRVFAHRQVVSGSACRWQALYVCVCVCVMLRWYLFPTTCDGVVRFPPPPRPSFLLPPAPLPLPPLTTPLHSPRSSLSTGTTFWPSTSIALL